MEVHLLTFELISLLKQCEILEIVSQLTYLEGSIPRRNEKYTEDRSAEHFIQADLRKTVGIKCSAAIFFR